MKSAPIRLEGRKIRLRRVEHKKIATADDYERRLQRLQLHLLEIQQAYRHQGRRAVLLFEGWDAAGKGGVIRRLVERLDPRGIKVWPIAAPTPEEQGRHYLYRFWQRLPEAGALAVFDRSWYGRVLVERVEGFAPKRAWRRAYGEINEFERLLADDGARLVKIFLHISKGEQLKRFRERLLNPHKRWKITEEDLRNRRRWKDYQHAIEDMFDRTSTKDAPWHAIGANRKWYARVRALEIATRTLAEGVDLVLPPPSPALRRAAARELRVRVPRRVD